MKTTLEIQNLKCGGCTNTIITRINSLENVTDVTVNNENHTVTFIHKDDTTLQETINLLSKLGYPIVGENNSLNKKAKSFVSCAVGRMNS